MSLTKTSSRGPEALKRHYKIERELANRLRAASADQRKALYRIVYDELYLRVPDHPQNTRKQDQEAQQKTTQRQLRLLDHFLHPHSTFLEVGAGDCHLSLAVAQRVRQVYAVEVSEVIAKHEAQPANFTFILSDGVSIDVPPESIDIAYSHQLMEHLHPEDASEQLKAIYQTLAPGGVYVCITPNRLSGPHDISAYFDVEASGFHLKEYTYRELQRLLRSVGFTPTTVWTGIKGRFFRTPKVLVLALERLLRALPRRLSRRLTQVLPLRLVFDSMVIVGHKPSGRPKSASAPATLCVPVRSSRT